MRGHPPPRPAAMERAQCDGGEPMGTLSSNSLVLLAGSELCALTAAEGARHVLWKPADR